MAHFYLAEHLTDADCTVGSRVVLGGSEAKHAVTVSRVRTGERLLIGNGAGVVVGGTVVEAAADAARLALDVDTVARTPANSPRILLAQALAKGDRDELAVQAATELGVDGVLPWAAARSISRWTGPKVARNQARWAAIVREAAKQSIRPWLPVVSELTTTRELAALAADSRMLVLEPTAPRSLSELTFDGNTDIVLVVGPEGGITPDERKLLAAAGAEAVRLGPEVLRTSTAGPAAVTVLNVALGRWGTHVESTP